MNGHDDGLVVIFREALDGLQEGKGAEAVQSSCWFLHCRREEDAYVTC